jgi:hypothetical protein
VVGPVVIMVEMASDESLRRICYGEVDCRCLSRVARRPKRWRSPGETPLEFPRVKEVDQLNCLSHEHVVNLIVTPCGVVAIEVAGQNEPGRFIRPLSSLSNSGLNFVQCQISGSLHRGLMKIYWWKIDREDQYLLPGRPDLGRCDISVVTSNLAMR